MTVQESIRSALALLGYTGEYDFSNDSALLKRTVTIANAVFSDLFYLIHPRRSDGSEVTFTPITSASQTVDLPDRIVNDCFVYGLAMWLAQSENDGDNQQLFAALYNQKRAAASRFTQIESSFLNPWVVKKEDSDNEISVD